MSQFYFESDYTIQMTLMQPTATRSKWNMGKILLFWPKNDDEKWSRKNIF